MADLSAQSTVFLLLGVLAIGLCRLLVSKHKRTTLFQFLGHCTRDASFSSQYLPLAGKEPSETSAPIVDYTSIFPPSSRGGLRRVVSKRPGDFGAFRATDPTPADLKKNLISFEADYRNCGPSTLTPMQISLGEIQALGDFPDYAELGGVPLPQAYDGFQLETAIHRPYRPFRWSYHQTMSLAKLETNWWLELEKTYAETIRQRLELFNKHGKLVLDHLPGSELAAKEVMEMALQFYCARYPQFFRLANTSDAGWTFHNAILNNKTIVKDLHPLHVLLQNIPEDFAVMIRNPKDGYYYFRGGVICSSLGWTLGSKLGMKLREIHQPIPDYKEKMEFSMDRYFSKMPTDRPIQRGSWGLEVDEPLFMPPSDPHEQHRLTQDSTLELERLHLRVDWQTLRRLPLSGAIVFNFKGVFTPLTEFRNEPFVPALVRKVLTEGKKSIMEYKNTWHTEHVALPALERWAKEQEESGVVPQDWQVETLAESPMYPGWEEKWHRQQGF